MRDLLKKIFSRNEPETQMIELKSVPGLLESREKEIHAALLTGITEPARNIRNAIAQLRHILNTIAGAEQDPELHPRLKNIAKNSLPQFIKSMNSALVRELPEDPEEFYAAAVECVKGSLNSVKGPGRYLQIVFPEEMKASRAGIDAIGREINMMNTALTAFRRDIAAITEARELYSAILAATSGDSKAGEKEERTAQRIAEMTSRLDAIGRELITLPDDPRKKDADEKLAALTGLEQMHEQTGRTYAAFSMTAAHVLRKAEKIAQKQKHPAEISTLKHAMFLLSDHELPDPAELRQALSSACPIAVRMIDAGEIALKNKEERAVFADTEAFCTEMVATCSDLARREAECRIARDKLEAHPIRVREGSLQREQAQLRAMLEKEERARDELREWRQKTLAQIPATTDTLAKKLSSLSGKDIRILPVDLKQP